MKKIFLVAVACAALVSCVKNELVQEQSSQRQITFQTVVKPETTRAAESYGEAPFSASAFKVEQGETWPTTTGVYFEDVTVKKNVAGYVGQWTTETPCYWPMAGTLTFYAHSPASIVADALVAPWNYTFTDYSMDNDVDFMVASIQSGLSANNVSVPFGHKLTKVAVKIWAENIIGGATYTLKSITFNNLADNATFTQTSTGDEAWSTPSAFTKSYTIFNDTMEVTAITAETAHSVDITKEFYVPHTLNLNAEMVVVYNVAEPGLGNKDYTKNVKFSDIHSLADVWIKNNQVTYSLQIGGKERIIWDTPTILTGWNEVGYSVLL